MILALTGVPLILVSIIAFIVIIGLIIILHEAGHFYFARKAGILCYDFSVGFGPIIYKKKYKETNICIRAIPVGGFVAMAMDGAVEEYLKVGKEIGLNFDNDLVSEIVFDEKIPSQVRGSVVEYDLSGKDNQPLYITINEGLQNQYYEVKTDGRLVLTEKFSQQLAPYDRTFDSKSIFKRLITMLAGPLMNFVLGIIIYIICACATGVYDYSSTKVGGVAENYPFANSDIQAGDTIKSVNGKPISTWNEFSDALHVCYENNSTEIVIVIERDGAEYVRNVTPVVFINSIGLSNSMVPEKAINSGYKGVIVGAVGNASSGTLPFATGAILTEMKIYTKGSLSSTVDLTTGGWDALIEACKDMDNATVKFGYYYPEDKNAENWTYKYVSSDDCKTITPWNNEVLNNQRVDKIVYKIGASPNSHFSFFPVLGKAFSNFWSDFTLIFRTLKLLIAPSSDRQIGINDMSSFVGIYSIIQEYVGAGFIPLLGFAAMLTVNIGIVNLLPIPGLDGGRIIFLLYEAITRRKPSKKVETTITNVFALLLFILFIYVTFNDVLRLFK